MNMAMVISHMCCMLVLCVAVFMCATMCIVMCVLCVYENCICPVSLIRKFFTSKPAPLTPTYLPCVYFVSFIACLSGTIDAHYVHMYLLLKLAPQVTLSLLCVCYTVVGTLFCYPSHFSCSVFYSMICI